MFDDEFIDSLPEDPVKAAYTMCKRFVDIEDNSAFTDVTDDSTYEGYLRALAAFYAFSEAYGLDYKAPNMGDVRSENVSIIRDFFRSIYSDLDKKVGFLTLKSAYDHYSVRFGKSFSYDFSEGDLKRIQTLINELRDLLNASELFDANHKLRLMKRLEALQLELHKKASSLDRFWGFLGDAGVAIGKFGSDAKPFVDRIKELTGIVWRTQARAEGLPSGTPLPLLTMQNSAKDIDQIS